MVRTLSTMLPLGTTLPAFEMAVVKGTNKYSHSQFRDLEQINDRMLCKKPVLVMIICAHCPFVKHIEPEITKLDNDYAHRVQIFAVSSNSLRTHPEDGPEKLALQNQKQGWSFPYLLDIDQSFAKSLQAACTPDFFLFSTSIDDSQKLQYRGQLDGSRPGNNIPLDGRDLRAALDAVLQGKKVCSEQKPSIGCNIKWHPGSEPHWFM